MAFLINEGSGPNEAPQSSSITVLQWP